MKRKEIRQFAMLLYSLTVCLLLWGIFLPELDAQNIKSFESREIRSESLYDKSGTILLEKYQYYYDHWSQKKLKHGLYSKWSRKGHLLYEVSYQDDERSGLESFYFRNKKVKKKRNWKEGLKEGKEQFFSRKGILLKEKAFVWGNREGLQKNWYKEGQLKRVRIIRPGEAREKALKYKKDGSLKEKKKKEKNTKQEITVPQPTDLKAENTIVKT
ncbi:MAG: hypothetical protein AAF696_08675 [Bacteroidota bacterium]